MTLTLVKDQIRLPIVAIDGPAGAGKSTVARWLAYQFRFRLIDTGALYRGLAYCALQQGLSLEQASELAEFAQKLNFRFGELSLDKDKPKAIPQLSIYINEQDLSKEIRSPEIGMAASAISKYPEVRDALLALQRSFATKGGVVMEGRDIGTVIFPNADLKFYLTASVESRSQRRFQELQKSGHNCELNRILEETKQRDYQDMNRATAPLRKAKDAVEVDSTNSTLDEVVHTISYKIKEKMQKK